MRPSLPARGAEESRGVSRNNCERAPFCFRPGKEVSTVCSQLYLWPARLARQRRALRCVLSLLSLVLAATGLGLPFGSSDS